MESDLGVQMKQAVLVVLGSLPDKEADRKEVASRALAKVSANSSDRKEAEDLICQLVRKSPRCYGVERRRGFWKIVLRFLDEEEAIRAYLKRFPESITDQQRQSIVTYLVDKIEFSFELVNEGLTRFGRHPESKSHNSQ